MRTPLRTPLVVAPLLVGSLGLALLATGCSREAQALAEQRYPLTHDTHERLNESVKKALTDASNASAKGDQKTADAKRKEAEDTRRSNERGKAIIEGALVNAFGSPATPAASGVSFLDPIKLARGRQFFTRNCSHCHGYYGQGDGPTAPFLFPRPRDFSRKGVVKFTSTNSDTRYPNIKEDLEKTIREGVQATAMPGFAYPFGPPSMHTDEDGKTVPNRGIEDVAQYVSLLLMRARLEGLLVNEWAENGELPPDKIQELTQGVIDDWKEAQKGERRVNPPKDKGLPNLSGAEYVAFVKKGEELFRSNDLKCASCHGVDGKGEGPSMQDAVNKKDDWGNELKARDLTAGIYRGGRRPIDLYRRVHAGIKGTPMPGFGTTLEKSPEKIWQIVEYVRSLAVKAEGSGTPAVVGPGEEKGK